MYQALYRQYRPRSFSDVVGQEHITETLRRQVASGRTGHAYLFIGTRGTGKTTCAKILARALNCEHPVNGDPCNECASCRGIEDGSVLDVAEIDAASNNGVDSIRTLREEAVYTPASVKKRVYIIDEVHMLSLSAFNALLKILEEPPEHLVFILATTERRKIPATILSRCQHFAFRRIGPELIQKRLQWVSEREGIALTEGASALLARLADGSMRDGLSLLEQCAGSGTVDEDAVIASVGLMSARGTVGLWKSLREGDTENALKLFSQSYLGGTDPGAVLGDLLALVRDMTMVRIAPKGGAALLTGTCGGTELTALSEGLSLSGLLSVSDRLQETLTRLPVVRDKRTAAELCLIRLAGTLSGTLEEEPAPVQEPKPVPKPVSEPTPEPSKAASPWDDAPKPTTKAAPSEPDGEWWGKALQACRNEIDGAVYGLLSNRGTLQPELSGNALTLHVANDFLINMINKPPVVSALAQAASGVLGRTVRVDFTTEPLKQELRVDKLDELKRFGNVKFE